MTRYYRFIVNPSLQSMLERILQLFGDLYGREQRHTIERVSPSEKGRLSECFLRVE